ncbi:MAG: Soluble aldose sugar dehydrogenase YliI precursor, partial [Planctomycetota bacterium]
ETKRDFDVWSDVFAGQSDRIVRVVAGQQANSWIAEQIAVNMGGHFDAISSAAYAYVSDADRASFKSTTTADQVIDALLRNLPTTFAWLQDHKTLATQISQSLGRPIRFVAYEGGPHLDSQGNAYEPAFFAAGNSPRMYDVYSQLLSGSQQAGLEMFGNFNYTGGLYPSSFGAFGALQSMTQVVSAAPKYRALYDSAMQGILPAVSITTVTAAASETGPTSGQWRVERSGATDSALSVNFAVSGSASSNDYTGIPSTLSFGVGESVKFVNVTPVDDTLVEGTEQVTFSLLASTAYRVDSTRASGTVSIADDDVAVRYGLDGAYYDNKDLTGYKFTRLDPQINFNWGSGSPDSRIGKETFSVRWTGQLQAVESGNYRLRTYSDDGVRVRLGGALVINNWTNHSPTYNTSANVYLTAGQKIDIQVEYFDNTGSAVLRLEWQRPGQTSFAVIPQSQLLAPSTAPARVATATSFRSSATASLTPTNRTQAIAVGAMIATPATSPIANPALSMPPQTPAASTSTLPWSPQVDQLWSSVGDDDEFLSPPAFTRVTQTRSR